MDKKIILHSISWLITLIAAIGLFLLITIPINMPAEYITSKMNFFEYTTAHNLPIAGFMNFVGINVIPILLIIIILTEIMFLVFRFDSQKQWSIEASIASKVFGLVVGALAAFGILMCVYFFSTYVDLILTVLGWFGENIYIIVGFVIFLAWLFINHFIQEIIYKNQQKK